MRDAGLWEVHKIFLSFHAGVANNKSKLGSLLVARAGQESRESFQMAWGRKAGSVMARHLFHVCKTRLR